MIPRRFRFLFALVAAVTVTGCAQDYARLSRWEEGADPTTRHQSALSKDTETHAGLSERDSADSPTDPRAPRTVALPEHRTSAGPASSGDVPVSTPSGGSRTAAVRSYNSASGTSLASANQTSAAPLKYEDVVAQLDAMTSIDPQIRAELKEDLRHTDPGLWPLMLANLRATMAFRQRNNSQASGASGNFKDLSGSSNLADSPTAGGALSGGSGITPVSPAAAAMQQEIAQRTGPQGEDSASPLRAIPVAGAMFTASEDPDSSVPRQGVLSGTVATAAAGQNPATPPTPTEPPLPTAGGSGLMLTSAASGTGSFSSTGGTSANPQTTTRTDAVSSSSDSEPSEAAYDSASSDWREHLARAIAALEMELQTLPADSPEPATARQPNAAYLQWLAQSTAKSLPIPASEAFGASAGTMYSPGAIPPGPAASPRPDTSPDPERARREAMLRMLYLVANRPDDAVRGIASADKQEQAFWQHQLQGLITYLDEEGMPVPSRRAAMALAELRQAGDHLAALSTLELRNLHFCTRVDSYGNFAEFDSATFRPDQEVLLYVEVDNFTVQPKGGRFETSLVGSYQVLDAAGQRVADNTFQTETEICRNRRRDFFIPFRMWIPKRLGPGSYTLQLTIEDLHGRKFGQSSIKFSVE